MFVNVHKLENNLVYVLTFFYGFNKYILTVTNTTYIRNAMPISSATTRVLMCGGAALKSTKEFSLLGLHPQHSFTST